MDVVESATIREPLCPFLVCSTLSLDSRFASRRVCFVSGRLVVALLAFFFLSLFFFFFLLLPFLLHGRLSFFSIVSSLYTAIALPLRSRSFVSNAICALRSLVVFFFST